MTLSIHQICEQQGAKALNVHNIGAGGVDLKGSSLGNFLSMKSKRLHQQLIRSTRKAGIYHDK